MPEPIPLPARSCERVRRSPDISLPGETANDVHAGSDGENAERTKQGVGGAARTAQSGIDQREPRDREGSEKDQNDNENNLGNRQ